jgi:hypothetical protein
MAFWIQNVILHAIFTVIPATPAVKDAEEGPSWSLYRAETTQNPKMWSMSIKTNTIEYKCASGLGDGNPVLAWAACSPPPSTTSKRMQGALDE